MVTTNLKITSTYTRSRPANQINKLTVSFSITRSVMRSIFFPTERFNGIISTTFARPFQHTANNQRNRHLLYLMMVLLENQPRVVVVVVLFLVRSDMTAKSVLINERKLSLVNAVRTKQMVRKRCVC